MLLSTATVILAFVHKSLATVASSDGSELYYRQIQPITEKEVDTLDLYANYAASAPCNVNTPTGEPVTCFKNCDRVEDDGAIVVQTFHGEQTQFAAYLTVVESRKQILFVGRGASNLANWQTCLTFLLVPTPLTEGAQIHLGFQRAWNEISEEVLLSIQQAFLAHPDYSLVFVGGSMGGAVATVGAAYLREAGYTIDLYTYGAPRVGNGILSDFITNQPGLERRVTHNADPVPRLPPTNLFPSYRHISPEIWIQGEPTNPDQWPVEDISVCEGNWNRECNANPSNPCDMADHTFYFGSLECWNPEAVGAIETLSIPPFVQAEVIDLCTIGSD